MLNLILYLSNEDCQQPMATSGFPQNTYMKNDSILLRICQHTCRLVAAVFRSGHPVHVKYLLHARRAGVSCELCSCDLSV